NTYSYARSNPITNKDPQGNQACELGCADLMIYPALAYYGPSIIYGAVAAETYITADMTLRGPRVYPGPGMDYQTAQLASENAYQTDPEWNPNWKGPLGAIASGLLITNWATSHANASEDDGPTNADVVVAYANAFGGPMRSAQNTAV